MSPQNTKRLFENYPILYRGKSKSLRESLMAFGFECEDGWFDIIDELSRELEKINRRMPEAVALERGVEAVQVKSKYASLCFYIECCPDEYCEEVEALIQEAERKSKGTCEECGKPGGIKGTSWVYACCDDCWDDQTGRPR